MALIWHPKDELRQRWRYAIWRSLHHKQHQKPDPPHSLCQPAPLPANEVKRLQALKQYNVLDSMAEQAFDNLVGLAAYICQTPMALISLVDTNRQWFKSKLGITASETHRDFAFCSHAILQPNDVMVVPDAHDDPRFAHNPLVTGDPHIRFYAGAPLITPEGYALGTLCVLDTVARQLSTQQVEALGQLSQQVVAQLELLREVNSRRRAEQEIRLLSLTDELTGLYNRRGFLVLAEQQLRLARRLQNPCWVMFMDVNGLKQVNDSLGHQAGDAMLVDMAHILQQSFRESDIVARLAGDEFTAFASATQDDYSVLKTRLNDNLTQFNQSSQRPYTLSVSIGVATYHPNTNESLHSLIARADTDMYAHKRLKV